MLDTAVFQGLQVCGTWLDASDRQALGACVENSGGKYSGVLYQTTSVLVAKRVGGAKYHAAIDVSGCERMVEDEMGPA